MKTRFYFMLLISLLTVTPGLRADFGQAAYLKAFNTGAGDIFGRSVAISGNTIVVGAPSEESSATGVNGNGANNSMPFSGAAYVYFFNGTNWIQQAYLKASNTDTNDSFGQSVAISGDTIIVGAPYEASNAGGVNGNGANNSIFGAGAAYIFVRNGTNWTQQAYVKASNPGINDNFGWAVTISGDTAVVGALYEASGATGINGNQANDAAPFSGAAYVFVRSGTVWTQQAYLKASNTQTNDFFGFSVALDGNTLVVGAPAEYSSAVGVNGNEADNSAPWAGAAYVFVRNGFIWTQQAYLKASNTESNDYFGVSCAISGDTLVVSSPFEWGGSTGVNGNQFNNDVPGSGAAYVFTRTGTNWGQQAYLKASNTGSNDLFGFSCALVGDRILISAQQENSNARGVNKDQNNDLAPLSGAAYLFTRSGNVWTQQYYLKASNTEANDGYGTGVGLSANFAVVGAWSESSSAVGVNGSQTNNNANSSGAAYVYGEVPPPQLPVLSIVPAGYFLRFNDLPGTVYNLQRAPVVTGPYTNIATVTVPASGTFQYHDSNPPPPRAFYKLDLP